MSWSLPAVPVAPDYLAGRALHLRSGAAAEREDFHPHLTRLVADDDVLLGGSERTEAGFLRMGSFFANGCRSFDARGRAGRTIEELTADEGIGGNIDSTYKVGAPVFGRLAEASAAQRQAIAGLRCAVLRLASLARGHHEIDTILRSLEPSGALLSIEDPATALEARGSSETLAEDLRRNTQRLCDWLNHDAEQIAQSSGQAARESRVRLTALAKVVASRKPVIAGAVGQVVVALQNHDSFRHRIERCSAALTELAAAVDAELDGPATGPLPIRFVSQVTPLEAEQVADMGESIAEAIAEFRDGLGRTVSELTAIVDSHSSREAREASRGASLDATIGRALALLAGTLETEREMIGPGFDRSTGSVRTLFPSYRSEIRTIDSDLALSAIKARIHSTRDSARSAFDILGAQDGATSSDARAISARRALEFSSLAGAPPALTEATETGLAARGLLGEELRCRVAAIAGPAGEPRPGLSRVQTEVEGIGVAFAVAPTVRRQLLAIASHATQPPLDTNLLPRTEARLADLRSRDTTASERALNDLAVGPGPTSPLKLTSGEEPANNGSVEPFYFQPSREAQPGEIGCRKEY
jgi:hypothetical protein